MRKENAVYWYAGLPSRPQNCGSRPWQAGVDQRAGAIVFLHQKIVHHSDSR